MTRAIALTVLAAAGCALVWIFVPLLLDWAHLGALDLPARVAAEFLFLSAFQWATTSWLHD